MPAKQIALICQIRVTACRPTGLRAPFRRRACHNSGLRLKVASRHTARNLCGRDHALMLTIPGTSPTIRASYGMHASEGPRMTSRRTGNYATLIGFLALTQTPALAQGSDQDREACTPDVFRLCGAYIPDSDRIVACLRGNPGALSPACRAVMNPQQTTSLRRPMQRAAPMDRRPVQARPQDDD